MSVYESELESEWELEGESEWEYEAEEDGFGTPMALMLLPHWTDGCIGSMEGLFFEASATTPFHFLTQVELSAAPSAAQRDLPYGTFDIDDHPVPTGREEIWRFTPLKRLRGVHDSADLSGGPGEGPSASPDATAATARAVSGSTRLPFSARSASGMRCEK